MMTAITFQSPRVRPLTWLAQRSAGVLLTLSAVSLWIAVALAGHLEPTTSHNVSIPRSALGSIRHLRLQAPGASYLQFRVVYEAREDVSIRWRHSNAQPTTWVQQGSDLVVAVPAQKHHRVEVAVPNWLDSLEAHDITVSTSQGVTVNHLTVVAHRADIQGTLKRLSVTAGHPDCSVGAKDTPPRYTNGGRIRIETERTTNISVLAASGSLSLSDLPSLESANITASPGVGLEMDDLLLLKRVKLDTLSSEATAATRWATPTCKQPTRD